VSARRRARSRRDVSGDELEHLSEDLFGGIPVDHAIRAGWDPLAALFHYGTRDTEILQGPEAAAAEARLRRKGAVTPPPSPFKRAMGRGLAVPCRPSEGEFPEVLLARRTWRGFGRQPLPLADLGSLLELTFGYQMAGTAQGGRVLFKTSPSAGACHPIEAYVLALRVKGLTGGLYHYSPRTRRLYVVRRGARRELVVDYLAGQWWYRDAAAIVFMTAVLPRVWWRYPAARSYRTVLLDAGHICQTFCLVATWLGLAPFSTAALADERVERDLGVDGTREILLYAAGVGSKPADGRWVQWPGNRPVPKRPRRRR
jgi:SagB-type dehydrogenase family enzyme